MNFVYDAVIEESPDGFDVTFPQFPEMFTFASSRAEAAVRAQEALSLVICEYIEEGKPLPEQKRVAEVLSVCASVGQDDIAASRCMTMSEAADSLGVTPARISQLAKSGKLQSMRIDGRNMVTVESVAARQAAVS